MPPIPRAPPGSAGAALDGRIVYVSGTKLVATEVEVAGTALQTGTTQTLFDLRSDATVYMFDIANDGRILALLNDRRDVMPIHLVTNWPSLLQRPQ